MKFEIAGLEESYGKHRYSNNAILDALARQVTPSSSLLFVWWTEKIFLDAKFEDTVDRLTRTDWFGVMHVPLLTPNWAMYSQNNLAKLYFMDRWRAALKRCRGIITLSEHMKSQVQAIYPDIPVFALKHPMNASDIVFDFTAFQRNPRLLLVGTWLRDFDQFHALQTPWKKKLILNHYARGFLEERYAKYRPAIMDDLEEIEHVTFLENDAYDRLVQSCVLYLGMHETSANNALCEAISYAVPFVARPHPAVEEYCGARYPLLMEDDSTLDISMDQVWEAHRYLKDNQALREALSIERFIQQMGLIYTQIAR